MIVYMVHKLATALADLSRRAGPLKNVRGHASSTGDIPQVFMGNSWSPGIVLHSGSLLNMGSVKLMESKLPCT